MQVKYQRTIIVLILLSLAVALIYVTRSRSAKDDRHERGSTRRTVNQQAEGGSVIDAQNYGKANDAEDITSLLNGSDPEFIQLRDSLHGMFLSLLRALQRSYNFSDEEVGGLATELATVRAAQILFESRELATVIRRTHDECRVEIAEYPTQGDVLKRILIGRLQPIVENPAKLEEFWNSDVAKEFEYFGRYPQELNIKRDGTARSDGAVEITRTLKGAPLASRTTVSSYLKTSQLGRYSVFANLIPE